MKPAKTRPSERTTGWPQLADKLRHKTNNKNIVQMNILLIFQCVNPFGRDMTFLSPVLQTALYHWL